MSFQNQDTFGEPQQDEESIQVVPMVAACGAALVGAVIWGLIAWLTGYEVGYVAWGIGLLVGFVVVKTGGRGVMTAGFAAGLTLGAIFVGKLMGTHFLVEKEFSQVREEYFTSELYNELKGDAQAFRMVPADPSDEDLREFMVEYNYGGFASTDQVSDEDLAYFQDYSIPVLERINADQPTFTQWQDQSFSEYKAEFDREFSLASAVIDELNGIDIIFAVLAVSTAYGLVKRSGSDPEVQEVPADDQEYRRAA